MIVQQKNFVQRDDPEVCFQIGPDPLGYVIIDSIWLYRAQWVA